jgi:sugar/nucleoside kinase (ribokinase family)
MTGPTKSPLKWLCYGDVGFDHYRIDNKRSEFLGGISLNHLVHLHRLGERSLSFYGPLSSGIEGEKILLYLKEMGVILENKKGCLIDSPPPGQYISLKAHGEKSFDSYEGEIFNFFHYEPLNKDFDVILLPAFEQNRHMVESFLKSPPEGDIVVDLLDSNDLDLSFLEPYQKQINMVVVGCPSENQGLFEFLKRSTSKYPWRLLVTRGERPGFFYDGTQVVNFLPNSVKAVTDSTGAGDAFLACFLHKIYGGETVKDSLSSSSLYAHFVLQKIGPH